ncbi:MAG TPA: hypothetical protein VN795_04390 [Stellaceae bacterium]|nr:hypothetical protein [Stellaceae bacterium]
MSPALRQLKDSERLDWLRLIRSENVGPVGIMQESQLAELKPQFVGPLAERRKSPFSAAPPAQVAESDLAAARKKVLELLSPSPVAVDELVRQCQLSPAIVLTVLLELELAGRIERQPGNTLTLL